MHAYTIIGLTAGGETWFENVEARDPRQACHKAFQGEECLQEIIACIEGLVHNGLREFYGPGESLDRTYFEEEDDDPSY